MNFQDLLMHLEIAKVFHSDYIEITNGLLDSFEDYGVDLEAKQFSVKDILKMFAIALDIRKDITGVDWSGNDSLLYALVGFVICEKEGSLGDDGKEEAAEIVFHPSEDFSKSVFDNEEENSEEDKEEHKEEPKEEDIDETIKKILKEIFN